MRVMVMVKATKNTEAGVIPDTGLFEKMGAFNEELVKAGVILAGEGLHPSKKGVRIVYEKGSPRVIDGPFAETKELIAGFWLWQVRNMEEAVAWLKRMPQIPGHEQELEVRPVMEADDFGEAFTPELREKEDQLRAESARRNG